MTFTDEQIKDVREQINVLRYLVESRADDLAKADNLYQDAMNAMYKKQELIRVMEKHKEIK